MKVDSVFPNLAKQGQDYIIIDLEGADYSKVGAFFINGKIRWGVGAFRINYKNPDIFSIPIDDISGIEPGMEVHPISHLEAAKIRETKKKISKKRK